MEQGGPIPPTWKVLGKFKIIRALFLTI